MTNSKSEVNTLILIKFISHDLRWAFAVLAEAYGLSTILIKRMLNHIIDNDVTGKYIITEQDTLRRAFN